MYGFAGNVVFLGIFLRCVFDCLCVYLFCLCCVQCSVAGLRAAFDVTRKVVSNATNSIVERCWGALNTLHMSDIQCHTVSFAGRANIPTTGDAYQKGVDEGHAASGNLRLLV